MTDDAENNGPRGTGEHDGWANAPRLRAALVAAKRKGLERARKTLDELDRLLALDEYEGVPDAILLICKARRALAKKQPAPEKP